MSPLEPTQAEFGERLAQAGASFDRAGVAAIYCVHGTFAGNDLLGLFTELSRFLPGVSQVLRRTSKKVVDVVARETGNYTPAFVERLQHSLARDLNRAIPVELFHWSGQNNHIARADGAVRLIAELARLAETIDLTATTRVQLWGHSHGGNVFALMTHLLGADEEGVEPFFLAARSFYEPWLGSEVDMPAWQQVRELLRDANHPLRKLQLDLVTFGTPIRYGWNEAGYDKLLHFVHHRPPPEGPEYLTPIPLKFFRALRAADGDYMQQIGISGTNFPPLPLAPRTLLADWRLDDLLEQEVTRESIVGRLYRRVRVADAGTNLLVDYQGIQPMVFQHLVGHALYTRQRWLPFHAEQIAERFYATS